MNATNPITPAPIAPNNNNRPNPIVIWLRMNRRKIGWISFIVAVLISLNWLFGFVNSAIEFAGHFRKVKINHPSSKIEWRPPMLPKESKMVFVSVGGGYMSWLISWMHGPNNGNTPIHFTDGFDPIRPYVESNRLYVNVDIPAPFVGLVKIRGHHISPIPPEWDINQNSNALEIVNQDNAPIFQMFYKQPDHVRVLGIFAHKDRVVSCRNNFTSSDPNDANAQWLSLKPIFKYPSWEYPSKLAN